MAERAGAARKATPRSAGTTRRSRQAADKDAPPAATRSTTTGTSKARTKAKAAPTGATTTTTAAGSAAKGATMTTKSAPKTAAASRSGRSAASTADGKAAKSPARRKTRSAAETERIRSALTERLEELRGEYDSLISELTDLQRDRLTDSAGDDQADTGTKTFEREQEISLANGIRDRVVQVERALERLDGGSYGYCERCGNPIPAERLAAFPSATLCVSCKQLEERR